MTLLSKCGPADARYDPLAPKIEPQLANADEYRKWATSGEAVELRYKTAPPFNRLPGTLLGP